MTSSRASRRPTRLLRAALDAAAAGLYVFPVQPRGKTPALGEDWQTLATRDPAPITAWWTARPFNVGIETGRSGLLVVDLDPARGHTAPDEWAGATGGREILERLANAAAEAVPEQTYTVTTPSGGTHLYFRARRAGAAQHPGQSRVAHRYPRPRRLRRRGRVGA
jgi:hypothetical protein